MKRSPESKIKELKFLLALLVISVYEAFPEKIKCAERVRKITPHIYP
jgi:hypothetical protein